MTLAARGRLAAAEAPDPAPPAGRDVLLRVQSVGVCGSDVHYFANGRIGSQVVQYPFRIGHEFSGVVERCGPAVTRVRPGDRVAVDPAMSCGACDQCLAGRRHTCRRLRFLGCPGQAEGCLCERIVMPEDCCFPVPAGLDADDAALVEPLAIGVYAANLAPPLAGADIGILGCGPIGLSVLLAARAAGARRIFASDPIGPRRQAAARHGADWAGDPRRQNLVAELREREPALLDSVFECCGQPAALDQAVELLKPGGTLMLVGIPAEDRVSFSIDALRRKELRIQNVRRQNECMGKAIALFASGGLQPRFMITHRFSLEQSQEAVELAAGYRDGVIKAMIHL